MCVAVECGVAKVCRLAVHRLVAVSLCVGKVGPRDWTGARFPRPTPVDRAAEKPARILSPRDWTRKPRFPRSVQRLVRTGSAGFLRLGPVDWTGGLPRFRTVTLED